MSETDPHWQTDLHAILLRPEATAVWLQPGEAGWTLPALLLAERLWLRVENRINLAWQTRLGLPVTVLYCAHYHLYEEEQRVELLHVLENHEPALTPPVAGQWLTAAELSRLTLVQPEHRPFIETALAEAASGDLPVQRPPWSRPGWLAQAVTWIESELSRLDYSLVGPVTPLNSWALSCVLRAPTTRGDVYFKAAIESPLFVNEPVILTELATLFPGHIPQPLSIDAARRWMLLGDFGQPVGDAPTIAAQVEMVRLFARIQLTAVHHRPHLLAIGCLDRRLGRLATQIEALINDTAALKGLSGAEVEQLQQSAPRLQAMCQALAGYGIPETLIHGDLHLGNVASQDGRMLFFDWTDAAISHPFLDMIAIFSPANETDQDPLRDAYLAHWSAYGSPAQLQEAWQLAERLSALYQAISYQHILAGLEESSRNGIGNVIPHYLRKAMRPLGA
jgi:hypothetical protein